MRRFFLYLLLFCFLGTGCGYTTSSALPGNMRRIYIEPFKNQITYTGDRGKDLYFPLLEVKVRSAIVERFQFDGKLRVADNPGDADLILKGELVSYQKDPLRYTDNNDILEYRIRIMVNLSLTDRRTDELIWEENGFSGEATYLLSGAGSVSETTAVENAKIDLAQRIVERTIENW